MSSTRFVKGRTAKDVANYACFEQDDVLGVVVVFVVVKNKENDGSEMALYGVDNDEIQTSKARDEMCESNVDDLESEDWTPRRKKVWHK
ncbi:uncharacterized protein SPSK_01314 [Sporothrix schenckii 1099-18]|uniref:Uncharacterized protein n=1 Tax=Sporothrix schenckii 1099-18 TaxID=1397361 RepID=A0A0F2LYB6_SPOSC|nr:uncharacterized protein SPSK_01314 [Sporothrix schenckii 1099-18]KJR81475.1 hypothetical protein SPSK_01314 [Sporothrix schenckii 1099-18]